MQNLFDALQRLRKVRNTEVRLAGNKTPLMLAAQEGNLSLVQDLLVDGADITAVDDSYRTALHHTARNNRLEVVNALLLAGSPIGALDKKNRSPVDEAKANNHCRTYYQIVNALETRSQNLDTQRQRSSHVGRNLIPQTYIWIDAIYMNQLDDAEKAIQVAQMGKIYSSAQTVISWLGRDKLDEDDTSVADLLLNAWRLEVAFDRETLSSEDIVALLTCPGQASPNVEKAKASWFYHSLKGRSQLQGLVEVPLLNRRWFDRSWVIQELILAQRVSVLCGPFNMSWDTLILIACITYFYRDAFRLIEPDCSQLDPEAKIRLAGFVALKATNWVTRNHVILLEEKRRAFKSQGLLSLMEAFSMSQNTKAGDRRDKVFAMLSMTTPIEYTNDQLSDTGRSKIEPDYVKPVEIIYINASKGVLTAHGLRMLSFARHSGATADPGLPSWTWNLTIPMNYRPLGVDSSWNTSPILQAIDPPNTKLEYCASDGTPYPNAWRVTSNNQLELKGYRWDTVDDVALSRLNEVGKDCNALSEWVRILSPRYRSPDNIRELLWRTFVSDATDTQKSSPSLSYAFVDWLKLLCYIELTGYITVEVMDLFLSNGTWANGVYRCPSPGRSLTARIGKMEQSLVALGIPPLTEEERDTWCNFADYWDNEQRMCKLSGSAGEFAQHMNGKDVTRRLFRTQNLSVGAGPALMRPGHMVFIIPDTSVPYVLRPVGFQRFKLIGEAYVYGIMHGQAFKDSNMELQDIIIV